MAVDDPNEVEAGEEVRAYRDMLAGVDLSLVELALRGRTRVEPSRPPTLPRWYESTVIDLPGTGAAFRIASLPPSPGAQALWDIGEYGPGDQSPASEAADSLGIRLESWTRGVPGDDVYRALLSVRPDHASTYVSAGEWQETDYRGFPINLDPALREFVARVATDPIVPVEMSPLRAVSINSLLHAANTTAMLGWAEASHDPLMLLGIPVGIVIIGGARGISAGLQEGLYRRIVKALTGTDPSRGPGEDDGGTVEPSTGEQGPGVV